MQNSINQATAASAVSATIAAAASAVVKNDTTATKAKPSIKLGAKAKVKLTKVAKAARKLTPLDRLQSMETATRDWETNELAASNKRKYLIMTDAYGYYLTMKADPSKETRAQYAADLAKFIEQRKYVFSPTSHDMTRVVKCVFGMDRRRVSAYSIALREALRQGVAAKDLVAFIEQEGGVEQIRLGGTKPLSAKVRASKVKDEVIGAELGMIKFDARFVRADADWADKQVVIVATYLPTGEFQANAVIRHDSAVNAALAAVYTQQQAAVRATAKAERDAEQKRDADKKKAAAKAKSAGTKNLPKPSKLAMQIAKTAEEIAAEAKLAANKESFNALLVENLA